MVLLPGLCEKQLCNLLVEPIKSLVLQGEIPATNMAGGIMKMKRRTLINDIFAKTKSNNKSNFKLNHQIHKYQRITH